MARLAYLVRYSGALLLFFGTLSLSHVMAPELGGEYPQVWLGSNQTEDVWLSPKQLKRTPRAELFIPGCMYLGPPTLKGLVERIGKENTFAAIGDVTRIRVFHDSDERNGYSIAYFGIRRTLTSKGPEALKLYIPFAAWRTKGNTYRAVGVAGYDCTKGLTEGDHVLVVLQRGLAEDWGVDPRLGEVWRVLVLRHLKEGPDDDYQYLYQLGDSRDAYSLDPVMLAKTKRVFVTDGRTLGEGIESVRMVFGAAVVP